MTAAWSIPGSGGQPILGDAHLPDGAPRGAALIAHGFKGYKDYGMFPRIAEALAGAGLVVHRFNFSHSGMTNATATFARPDLFEADSWNRQVFDVRAVLGAVADGTIAGRGLPYVLFGHSRGGATVLLAAGRHAGDQALPQPAGIATASSPSACDMMSPQDRKTLLAEGYLVSPSSRTGQALRVGKAFLMEQIEDPRGHDLLRLASRITCPALVVHGAGDPTVPALCARQIGAAIGRSAKVEVIEGADHVFNTPNPMPPGTQPSPQLRRLLDLVRAFALQVCASR